MKLICKIDGFETVIEIVDNLLELVPEPSNSSKEWNDGFIAFGNALKNALIKLSEVGDEEYVRDVSADDSRNGN